MALSTTRWLFWLSIAITVLGSCLLSGALPRSSSGGVTYQSGDTGGIVVAGIFIVIACVLVLIAWVGALVRTAQLGRWGWFVSLILLGSFALLAYVIASPDTPPLSAITTPPYQPPYQPPYYP
ncbi:MAG: hypothetical protein OJF49_001714 [Ktedonobacterales bacterium]|nr:MAG: hypothetical protein OJF49_001714 [Ktedonobacterales bacterium]